MRILYTLLTIFHFIFITGYTQQPDIMILAEDSDNQWVYLTSVRGEFYLLEDSATFVRDTAIFFNDKNLPGGVYRLYFSKDALEKSDQSKSLDFIFESGSRVVFRVDIDSPNNSAVVISSESNRIFRSFQYKEKLFQQRLMSLQSISNLYSPDDTFYKKAGREYQKLQKDWNQWLTKVSESVKGSFLEKYLMSERVPLLAWEWKADVRQDYLKTTYLEFVDFSDASLIHSSIFTDKSISFLALFRDETLDANEQQRVFGEAAKTILEKASVNPAVYSFLLNYLVGGFERFGMEKVLESMAEFNKNHESCLVNDESLINERLTSYLKLAPGTPAPEFSLKDSDGKTVSGELLKGSTYILIFWASWCPHCQEILPVIKQWYELHGKENYKVVTVSLDNNRSDLKKGIQDFPDDWINLSDLRGWDGNVVQDFYIYGTPSFFLIDKEGIIIGKAANWTTFLQELK